MLGLESLLPTRRDEYPIASVPAPNIMAHLQVSTDYEKKLEIIRTNAAKIPGVLSSKEDDYLGRLFKVAKRRRDSGASPDHLFLITDILRDPDDQNAFLQLTLFIKLGLVDVKTVLCSNPHGGQTTTERAAFLRLMLNEYGIHWVKTVAGFAYDANIEDSSSGGRKEPSLDEATSDLKTELAIDDFYERMTVVCLAPTYDMAAMIEGFHRMRHFVFQSGVQLSSDDEGNVRVAMDQRRLNGGQLETSYNANGDGLNSVNVATNMVYDFLNDNMSVNVTCVNKYAAREAPVDGMAWYEKLTEIGKIVLTETTTEKLSRLQRDRLVSLFSERCGKDGKRMPLEAWEAFLEGAFGVPSSLAKQPKPGDWDFDQEISNLVARVKTFSIYDGIAFLFSVDDVVKEFDLVSGSPSKNRVEIGADNINAVSAQRLLRATILAGALLGREGV